jgi:bisphosphoglycerate-independent phosphoglycerate mutase (AlkP superfamily)
VLLHLEVAIDTALAGEATVIVGLTTLKIGCSLAIGGGHLVIEGDTIVNMKIATITLDLKQEDLLSKKLLRKVSKFPYHVNRVCAICGESAIQSH